MHGWQAQVKVRVIYCDEDKAIRAGPSENLQQNQYQQSLNLQPSCRSLSCLTMQYLQLGALLHIHSVVEECEIVELLQQIDLKTRNP
ncbi:hypothetical protein SLEP1_g47612 [Rubroshorea leprosula]|uniref:Uncharacterized protein n=1 Tax=Rubroshorea leprosula TaxID=152421 RepID=A0AAV5LTV7_9ROSI|nr:hypothetical protein SLEP1_g47612 [Rubroshorea leprosula]